MSGIAARFGLSTASVLALNGLSWKSLIFPGQKLELTATATAAPAPTSTVVRHYVIRPGDTISGIAEAHGVSTDAVLKANGLDRSSVIFPGHTITLPDASPAMQTVAERRPIAAHTTAPTPVLPTSSHPIVALSDEQRANARLIVRVGRSEGVSDYGLIIALAAAAQESGLLDVDEGDEDSLGLFQQRPSMGWGTPDQIMDPDYAARAFFGGAGNPNPGRTRGLLDVPGWQSMTVTEAAQAVQISAYPDSYAKWEASARLWLDELG